jgi:hyperosmotically inducible periplasmic protein
MSLGEKRHVRLALQVVMAGALALGLAACEREQSPERIGRQIDRAPGQTIPQLDQLAPPAAGARGADLALADRVKAALTTAPDLQFQVIDVVVSNGVVLLQGTAETPADRDKAGQIASGVEGVKSVENQIAVKRGS